MTDCNGVDTPTGLVPIGRDVDGPPFAEAWEYRTILGMLMYIPANTRPDTAYAVHQAARFSHAPRNCHAFAIKRILRYLQQTKDKELKPNEQHKVDCYVEADFAGTFASEDPTNPESVKSRTGYIILYRGSPLLWVSNLQTQIALSTMEAEYVAVLQSMRDLIPIQEILKEIMAIVYSRASTITYNTHSKAFSEVACAPSIIAPSTVYEDNAACLKFAQTGQLSPRTKHIGIPYYHWFRSKVTSLDITVVPVSTHDQLADTFTKGLCVTRRERRNKFDSAFESAVTADPCRRPLSWRFRDAVPYIGSIQYSFDFGVAGDRAPALKSCSNSLDFSQGWAGGILN